MNIGFEQVSVEHKQVLENLMTLFLHDLSEFADDIRLDASGMHRFDVLDLFFEKEGLTPYFIRSDEEILGFVLIQSGEYTNPEHADYVINSFFILRRYRGRGIGASAASAFLRLYPGRYCCGQLQSNVPAVRFWKKVYGMNGLDVFEIKRMDDDNVIVEQYFTI